MHTTLLEEDCANYNNKTNVIETIATGKIRDLIAEEFVGIYSDRTQAEFQVQIDKTLVEMLQLGNTAASNRFIRFFAGFLETVGLDIVRQRNVDEVLLLCL